MLYTYLEHMYDYYVSETKPGTPSSSCSFVNTISLTVKKKTFAGRHVVILHSVETLPVQKFPIDPRCITIC